MMARGKQTCKILKEIRRQIAEANGIEFATSECRYKGDCLGTCPKCESEVRYLEQQLRARTLAGKAVALAGISAASLAMLMPISADAQIPSDTNNLPADSVTAIIGNSVKIKGVISDALDSEILIGVTIHNLTNGTGTLSNIDGEFEIDACVGDSIEFSYVGYFPKTICVKNTSEPLTILLEENNTQLLGEYEMVSAILDLNVKDEHGKLMEKNKLRISRIRIDENGEEDCEALAPEYLDEKTSCRIYWDYDNALEDEDGKSLKEATLRIEAEGYDDPITIKVKYPKGKAKKTIKFKHKKK
ncbi:MAG: carboxypeptidase-like regulatory domain-containing protein [Paramuribaculum sp.]|nr:carboxypeptidase-like regulatory domain-containing protein [Paramuribaculum sp.]